MARDNPVSRRTALKLTGAAASTAFIAGCSGGGNGNGNGNGTDESSGAVQIDPDTEIMFKADGQSWVGQSPSSIEGKTNPTIELTEGGSYTIGWTQNAGGHNFALFNGDGSVWNGKKTSIVQSSGEGQTLDFTASTDIAEYVCEPHHPGMAGTIEVTGGSSSDGGSGNESNSSNSSSE